MGVLTLEQIAEIRLNPQYRLASWDSLAAPVKTELTRADPGAQHDVVLAGRQGAQLRPRLLNARAAALLAEARGSSPVSLLVDRLGECKVVELVVDGVLEVRHESSWVGGPVAYEMLGGSPSPPKPQGRLSELSYEAVRWAAGLPTTHIGMLSSRLYGFGRLPLSQRWVRAYPDGGAAVRALLSPVRPEQQWQVAAVPPGRPDWLTFRRRGRPAPTPRHVPLKLYVSPHPDGLADVLRAVVQKLAETSVLVFKMGLDAAGLLRPDKLVVYVRDAAELASTARALAPVLQGVRPHGVPFSAEVFGQGVLSWGADPPSGAAPVGDRSESWRLLVCRTLAEALADARRAPLRDLTPQAFALGRLALDGVRLPSFAPPAVAAPLLSLGPGAVS